MDVAIAGGHGRVALLLAQRLIERGDSVRSLIRNPDHADDVRAAGGEPVLCDLEEATDDEVALAVDAVDAVVFAAGAGPGSGAARKETMDYGGAAKLIEAAKAKGIERFSMVSSIGADPAIAGEDTFDAYLRAKGRADVHLRESGLVYTIVRPGGLVDDDPTGRVRIGTDIARGTIPRGDVAELVASALHNPSTLRTTFEATSGDVPIDQALDGLRAD